MTDQTRPGISTVSRDDIRGHAALVSRGKQNQSRLECRLESSQNAGNAPRISSHHLVYGTSMGPPGRDGFGLVSVPKKSDVFSSRPDMKQTSAAWVAILHPSSRMMFDQWGIISQVSSNAIGSVGLDGKQIEQKIM